MHADRIYVFEKGKVAETGSHYELLDRERPVLCHVASADRRKKELQALSAATCIKRTWINWTN